MTEDAEITIEPGAGCKIRITADGRVIIRGSLLRPVVESDSETDGPTIDDMFTRFERHSPQTRARKLHYAMMAEGWNAVPPEGRSPGSQANPVTYVRYTYRQGQSSGTLYLNSRSLFTASQRIKTFASSLPGADPRTTEVYFQHSPDGFDQALSASKSIREWIKEQEK